MKRSEFLRKLGLGLGVAVVAPTVFAEKNDFTPVDMSRYIAGCDPYKDNAPVYVRDLKKHPMTYDECFCLKLHLNDLVRWNKEQYLVVYREEYNSDYLVTLRPIKIGDDITITEKNFFINNGIVGGSLAFRTLE